VSLANVARWLGEQADALGVEIYPGFAGAQVLFDENGAVKGVCTGDMGIAKDGSRTAHYQPGMELHAKYTVFAEGARGHLGKQLMAHFDLNQGRDPQAYGLGIKEIWQVPAEQHQEGLVVHTAGWPLDSDTYGGTFLYHLDNQQIALGMVVGLDYQNPYLSPFEEFQRYKTHPAIAKFLKGGKRLSYGARAITAGGILSLPQLYFKGGVLVGCEAGTLNASRIKGSHGAIKTGMLAAAAIVQALADNRERDELPEYEAAFHASWLKDELWRARNFKQWFKKGRTVATLMTGIEQKLLGGKFPWTIHRTKADHECLLPAAQCSPIAYPKPDNVLTFDRLSSVFVSNTNHEENQPAHLQLKDAGVPIAVNLAKYAGPEARFCPAGVYEFIEDADNIGQQRLQINAQNCVHCKTCDIKDPTQNINWVTPEGGGGPTYTNM
jgi:electron-transferring-flavoprotein dehydrogenase